MGWKSRNRLAADWFARIRQNATTLEVEHPDVVAAEEAVENIDLTAKADVSYVDTQLASFSTSFAGLSDATVSTVDPTISANPSSTGHLWINKNTGDIFTCSDNTTNENKWLSSRDSAADVLPRFYVQATGGTITTSGDYKTHTFTASDTFTITGVGNTAGSTTYTVDVVAGGGGGAGSSMYRGNHGGSGGSGGRSIGNVRTASLGSTAVTVGAKGYGACCGRNWSGGAGGNSSFGSITTTGGGGGIHGYSQTGYGGAAGSPGGTAGTNGQNRTTPWGTVNSWNGYGGAGTAGNLYGAHWAYEQGYYGQPGVVKITYKYKN